MIDVHGLVQRQKKYMYYLLALLVLGWGFTSYKDVFLGLIIGTIFSFLSLRIIARRTDKLLDRVTNGENVKFKATPSIVRDTIRPLPIPAPNADKPIAIAAAITPKLI